MGILTAHKLARELLKEDDKYILASDGEKDYVIENYKLTKTHANSDDFSTYVQLNLREISGNIIR